MEFTGEGIDEQRKEASVRLPGERGLGRKTKLAAQMLGIGYTVEEVAGDLQLEPSRLRVLLRSKLFRTEMDKAAARFIKAEATYAKERIHAKTPSMMDIVEEMAENPKTPASTRANIAFGYIDRVVPTRSGQDKQAPTVVINISSGDAKNIEATLVEYTDMGGEDIEPATETSDAT